jgi:hypothetical protein
VVSAALARVIVVLALIGLLAPAAAHAQPRVTPSDTLREANSAALAGDWTRVSQLVDPLLVSASRGPSAGFATPDLAEAHRLAGLAAFFHQRADLAERHFVTYLRIDRVGRLDPALYPPDVVAFFNDVATRHDAEIRAVHADQPQRSWWRTLLPPLGQLQNGEPTKAYVLTGVLGALLVVNLTTYAYLRAWCNHTDGSAGGALTCDEDGGDHFKAAKRIRPYNIGSGIGLALTYTYGVYDGVRGYRRRSREQQVQPFFDASGNGAVVGIVGSF